MPPEEQKSENEPKTETKAEPKAEPKAVQGPSQEQNKGQGRGPGRGGQGRGRGGPGFGPRQRQTEKPPQEYEEEVLAIDRVTRVVKGGRRLRFRATVVVGNKKGKVGLGIGKSHEVMLAIQKAVAQAKKNLITVNIWHETIPHDIYVKFKSAKILLLPASPGTGIIAGGAIRKVVELAGIKNILSKALGASNRITNAHAAIIALKKLVLPKTSKL